VYFDVEDYVMYDMLMLTNSAGLAVHPVDASRATYVRIGAVQVYVKMGGSHDSGEPIVLDWKQGLISSDYPQSTSIILL
jgi:hypothetical protein